MHCNGMLQNASYAALGCIPKKENAITSQLQRRLITPSRQRSDKLCIGYKNFVQLELLQPRLPLELE
jgi:hypothetical protein